MADENWTKRRRGGKSAVEQAMQWKVGCAESESGIAASAMAYDDEKAAT
jgi:hypothetical protein